MKSLSRPSVRELPREDFVPLVTGSLFLVANLPLTVHVIIALHRHLAFEPELTHFHEMTASPGIQFFLNLPLSLAIVYLLSANNLSENYGEVMYWLILARTTLITLLSPLWGAFIGLVLRDFLKLPDSRDSSHHTQWESNCGSL